MKTIAILACGTIGSIIASKADGFGITAVYDQLAERRSRIALLTGAADCADFATLLRHDFDLLVEAASPQAVRQHAPAALSAGRSVFI